MEKLQLYMTMTQGDYREMLVCNADEYVQSYVQDLKEAVCQVNYPPSQIAIFYMLKYVDTGLFIIVFRTIPSVAGNHLASWIYVPYGVAIAPTDVIGTVDFIVKKVSGAQVSARDVAEIRERFAREYPADAAAPYYPACDNAAGQPYAYRYYGPRVGVGLNDLLSRYRFQPAYLSFPGVLLVDQDVTTDISGTNLTSASLEDTAVLFPPEAVPAFVPTIYGQPFDVPYAAAMGENVEVIWEPAQAGTGKHAIKQAVYVSQPEMQSPSLAGSHKPKPIAPQPRRDEEPADTPATPSAVPASKKKTYRFQLPAKSSKIGSIIEFEITTNGTLVESPIDGYEPTGDIQEGASRSNQLLFKATNVKDKLLSRGLYALAGLAVGFLLGTLTHCDGPKQKPAPAAAPPDSTVVVDVKDVAQPEAKPDSAAAAAAAAPTDAATVPADVTLAAAVAYLDSHQVWRRDEMEAYPDLRGLFDDMNAIKRSAIVDTWAPKLAESRKFQLVARHAKESHYKSPRKNPFVAADQEQKFGVQAYLNNIDP